MTFDASVGTLTSTSYLSVARLVELIDNFTTDEASNAFYDLYPNPIGADEARLERNLMRVTAQADASYEWIGTRAEVGDGITDGQRLEWPRARVPRDGWKSTASTPILPDDIIPFEIELGLAYLLISFSQSDRASNQPLSEIKSVALEGVASVTFRDEPLPLSMGTIPSEVHDFFRKFGRLLPSMNSATASTGSRRMLRGD